MPSANRLAAVDLGSNSFRLEIGRVENGAFVRTEYIKESVRQGAGLDADRKLTPEALQAGWDCLARFGERLAGFAPSEVFAVATQTLREARNRDAFLQPAAQVLGFPIHVVSGREEARLIYQGVAELLTDAPERRLVIDIGGRSTELILGQGRKPVVMESFRLGSTSWSLRFFPQGQFTAKAFELAEVAATAVLDGAFDAYHPDQWDRALGSAGTIGAIGDVLQAGGWPAGPITQDGLDWLRDRLLQAQSAERLRLPGMREDRKAIIGGGLCVLRALFKLLDIRQIEIADGGLRQGLIRELMGDTLHRGDLRLHSVQRLAHKFSVDTVHGQRVAEVACTLFQQFRGANDAPQDPYRKTVQEAQAPSHEQLLQKLHWAAELHEIGAAISHSEPHKHGAYILDNADALGFTVAEMHRLSLLVLGHRGKLRKLDSALHDSTLVQQLVSLRLAVILCHARRTPDLSGIALEEGETSGCMRLVCNSDWVQAYPQSAHLLREEVLAWDKTPWKLEWCLAQRTAEH